MMGTDMFLYWGSGSGPCWRVMIVLEEKALQGYGQKLVSFSNKENKSEEILKLNPRGQVPTFRHGSLVINESMAACEYLESVFASQGTKLIPDEPAAKARVLQRMHEAAANIQKKVIEEVVYYQWKTKKEDQDADLLKTKKQGASDELALWEGYVKEQGAGFHLTGKDFTMADAVFFPMLAFCVRSGVDLNRYPFLQGYYMMVLERPSVKASWPPHWKDSDPTTLLSGV